MFSILMFANGVIDSVEWIRPYLKDNCVVIAANGGTRHLMRLGRVPDLVIGDADSLSVDVAEWLAQNTVEIRRFPAAKDETDLELALLHAAVTYQRPIQVFGAFGGRIDQALANLLLLAHPDLQACSITLLAKHQMAWMCAESAEIHGATGDTVSLLPLGGSAVIASTTGLQWPLQNSELVFGPARGISNILTAPTATLTVASGMVWIVHVQRAFFDSDH